MSDATGFDYVIVGAGAAGCVIAYRLISGLDCRVLLLEAGGPDDVAAIHRADLPSMFSLWGSDVDWKYVTEPQERLDHRGISIAQGKTLGGSSSINAMMYIRGNRRDYDHWNQLGNEGWDYESVLPYFRRSEDYEGGASQYRGAGGPLRVIQYAHPSPASQAFVAAAKELGFAGDDWDCNGAQQENGAFFYQSTRSSGDRRCSTADAYLRPILNHPRLSVETDALTTRVLLSRGRATGVEYVKGGNVRRVRADAEVILCCGSFASPKLLMLSGIGPAAQLRARGIDVVVDLPGVGQNLQDHLLLGVGYQCLQPQPQPALLTEAGLFVHTRDGLAAASPELQFFFGPVQFVEPEYRTDGPGFTFAPLNVQPQSRGSVELRSNDPRDLAVVRPNYLQCQTDTDVLVKGIELARRLAHTRAFDGLRGKELAPGEGVTARSDLEAYIRKVASTVWHPVGSCKMGRDLLAVVNPRLQAYGVDGLRVADASIMPRITSGNTNAPTIMIAEKAADMIIADRPTNTGTSAGATRSGTMASEFDYIIVGSGAAGSTLAYRLSEMSDVAVLVLEAGGTNLPEAVEVPYRWNELLLTDLDYAYTSVPQPGLNGRQIYCAAGKAMGGTSILYHMMHVRGRTEDFANWVYNGCAGWTYEQVLPYYRKLENQVDDTNPTAGKGGPINVINASETGNPVSATFLDACVELGYPLIKDFNAERFGASWHHVDMKDGKRGGVLTSYLLPALTRPNVTLSANTQAARLVLEGGRCVGVEILQNGQRRTVRATREVILCCGAIESPKLLLLSGIGDPAQLREFGIPTTVELPGVGLNFQDHPLIIGPVGRMSRPGPDPRGNMTEVGLFWRSEPTMPVPDLEICLVHRAPFGEAFFTNVVRRMQTGQPITPVAQLVDPHLILSLPGLIRPLSRGWVRLRSSDPTVPPEVNPNYGSERTDIERIVMMVKIARDIYRTKAFTTWGLQEVSPGPAVATDVLLRDWVVNNIGSYYHFAGSCKMGVDELAVVDLQLRVHGVAGLRVVDGSVMPTVPSANPHTTVVMIAERAADFIKAGR